MGLRSAMPTAPWLRMPRLEQETGHRTVRVSLTVSVLQLELIKWVLVWESS